jgi:hypothetical protein
MATRARTTGTGTGTRKTAAARKARIGKTPKTRPEAHDVGAFLEAVEPAQRRDDARALAALMHSATGCEPVMWGAAIVGYDRYHYRYDSGHEGEAPMIGFSPRKQALVLYVMPGFAGEDALLARLGRYTRGKSCLYLKRLSDVDPGVLEALVREAVAAMRQRYPR